MTTHTDALRAQRDARWPAVAAAINRHGVMHADSTRAIQRWQRAADIHNAARKGSG